MGALAYRLTGSSDLYEQGGRKPYASINFTTAHDGFTLNDLVSYNEKHNEANGEENRDGPKDNISWKGGVEGASDDPRVAALRAKQRRNLMATLLLSQGVPMIQGGDELCRTTRGNNNTYCQDNELSWIDWDLDREKKDMLEFTRFVIGITKRHPVLRRRKFFQGRSIRGSDVKDLTWLKPEGQEMTDEDWGNPVARCIGLRMVGDAMDELDDKGRWVRDGTLLLLINAFHEKIPFVLPIDQPDAVWGLMIDTREPTGKRLRYPPMPAGEPYELEERSLALFNLSRME